MAGGGGRADWQVIQAAVISLALKHVIPDVGGVMGHIVTLVALLRGRSGTLP